MTPNMTKILSDLNKNNILQTISQKIVSSAKSVSPDDPWKEVEVCHAGIVKKANDFYIAKNKDKDVFGPATRKKLVFLAVSGFFCFAFIPHAIISTIITAIIGALLFSSENNISPDDWDSLLSKMNTNERFFMDVIQQYYKNETEQNSVYVNQITELKLSFLKGLKKTDYIQEGLNYMAEKIAPGVLKESSRNVLKINPQQVYKNSFNYHFASNLFNGFNDCIDELENEIDSDLHEKLLSFKNNLVSIIPLLSPNLHEMDEIQEIINHHLKTGVSLYKNIPVKFRNNTLETNKSPHQLFVEQIVILDHKIVNMEKKLAIDQNRSLLVQNIFIEEKFNEKNDSLLDKSV